MAPATIEGVEDCEALRTAIRHTIAASPSIFQISRSKRGEISLWRCHLNIGARLSRISSWSEFFGAGWLDFTCEIAAEQLAEGDVATIANTQACEFVAAVIRQWSPSGGKWASLAQCFVTEIGNRVITGGQEAGEWSAWSWFIKHHRSLFSNDALDEWRDRTYTFCINEVDVITDNADSGSQAEDWFGDVKEAAEAWGFSLEAEQKKITTWIADRDSRSGSDDEWEGGGSGNSDLRPDGTDRALDRLFASLAGRGH